MSKPHPANFDETAPATRRGRQTLEAFDTAARTVIAEKGFLKMTVADIAAEAGRSVASFYNYYDSKEQLMGQWARQFREDATARAESMEEYFSSDPRQMVHALARAHWETFRLWLAEMIGIFQLAMIDDDFARVWNDIRDEAVAGITARIVTAQSQGYCPGSDAETMARAIVAMMNMFCYDQLANGKADTADDELAITTLSDMWYHAVYWR